MMTSSNISPPSKLKKLKQKFKLIKTLVTSFSLGLVFVAPSQAFAQTAATGLDFTFNCSHTIGINSCTFDASASTIPSGTIKSYIWQFSSSPRISRSSPILEYVPSYTGTWTVRLSAVDNNNNLHGPFIKPIVIQANAPAVASFTSSCTGGVCIFDASASYDPDGTITEYLWEFDNEKQIATNRTVIAKSFTTFGSHYITLRVRDNAGRLTRVQSNVLIARPTPPPAREVAVVTANCTGLTCSFDSLNSTVRNVDGYYWTISSGGTGIVVNNKLAPNFTFTFPQADFYDVRLSVLKNNGGHIISTKSISVIDPTKPKPGLGAVIIANCNGLTCDLDGSGSTGSIYNWGWAVNGLPIWHNNGTPNGNDNGNAGENISYTFPQAGTYQLGLTIKENKSNVNDPFVTATTTQVITVGNPLAAPAAVPAAVPASTPTATPTTTPSAPAPSGSVIDTIEDQGDVTEAGDGYFVVNGMNLFYTSDVASFEDGFGPTIQVGDGVQFKADEYSDGTLIVTQVEVG